jgi:hypothetical protein
LCFVCERARISAFRFIPLAFLSRSLLPEPKPSDSTLDSVPVPLPPQSDPFFDELLTSSKADGSAPPTREGLPPSYKMRNAHYVDELETRARRLREDEPRVQTPSVSDAPIGPPPRLVVLALNELTRGLDGLASCFNLVSAEARPLRERLGRQLAQVEARRASRISHSLRILLDEPRLKRRAVNLAELLERVLDDMRDEFQLVRIDIRVDSPDRTRIVWADGPLLGVALSGIVGSLVATLESVESPAVLRTTVISGDGLVTVRLQAEGAVLPAEVSRVFDLEWLERPGGIAAGTTLVAARRIAQLHDGRLEAAQDQGGLVMSLSLPVRD